MCAGMQRGPVGTLGVWGALRAGSGTGCGGCGAAVSGLPRWAHWWPVLRCERGASARAGAGCERGTLSPRRAGGAGSRRCLGRWGASGSVREHRGVCECGGAQGCVCVCLCAGTGALCTGRACPSSPWCSVLRGVEVAVSLGGGNGVGGCRFAPAAASGVVLGGERFHVAVCVPSGKRGGLRESGICPQCRSVRALRMGNCSGVGERGVQVEGSRSSSRSGE